MDIFCSSSCLLVQSTNIKLPQNDLHLPLLQSRRHSLLSAPALLTFKKFGIFKEQEGGDGKNRSQFFGRVGRFDMLFFGRTQENLVNQLSRDGVISESRVKRAMLAVDRALYVDNEYSEGVAYMDEPLPLGQTSETISAPHMHGVALEFLQSRIGPGARVLDVGAGSGYLTACFGELAKPDGYVLGIEKHKSLTDRAIQNIRIANPDLLDNGIVEIIHGNIYSNILDEYEGFDAIHVGAAAESMPQVLIDKLNDDGLMLIPIGPTSYFQQLKLVRKKDGEVEFKDGTHVRYVPLTQPEQSQRNTSSLQ